MNAHDDHGANILLHLEHTPNIQYRDDFLTHLAECAHCRKQLEEEQAPSSLLRRCRPLYAASEALRTRVVASAAQQTANQDKRD